MTFQRAFLIGLVVVGACTAGPEEPREPVCDADKPCTGGLVCRVDPKPELNVCVPCTLDNECGRIEFCHPIERRCRLRPCFGEECTVHDDCALGQFCVQGKCLVGSETTEEGCAVESCAEDPAVCDAGQRCHPVNLVCEEDLGCQLDAECGEDQRCVAGRCELGCTPETAVEICGVRRVCDDGACVDCTEDAHCGAGLKCNVATKICESPFSCQTNRDCQAPLVCNRLTKECTVDPGPCLSAGDCPFDETCQLSTGKCVPLDCPVDRFEPNDQLETATPIQAGATTSLSLCEGDVDYFRIALAHGDRLQAVADVDPLLSFEMALLGLTGEEIAVGEFDVRATVSIAGDYIVRVRSADPYVRYGLRLSISRGVPCEPDEDEPNDTYVTSTPIGPGDVWQRTICPGDEDWFQIAVTLGQTVEVELESTPLDGDLDLFLYDSDGLTQLAQSATAAEVETVKSSAFTGSRVYVKVAGATPSVQNRYDLHVRVRQ